MRKLFHALASLWMTIPILVVIAAILIFATFFDGLDVTIGAVRKDWYRSWWFNGLLGLLAVNLIACTVKRKPYQLWMWGFLKTHTGILLIIIGSMVSSMFKIYGDMPIAKGASLDYVQLEDQRELTLQWFGSDQAYTFPADYNWYRASEPNEVFAIPDSESRVRIKSFFPNVVRQPPKLPERVEVVIHQGNRETPPFVIPVNKATPIPGSPLNITFVNTSEERYLDLKNAGPDGSLDILIGEASLQIDVTRARTEGQPLPGEGTLKVLEVYESLVIDEDGNVVDIAGNPGVKIQVVHPTLGGSYFVLEGPPAGGFYAEGEKKGQAAPFEILYQSPLKGSHFAILRTPQGWRYYTTSSKGASAAGETELGGKVRLPFMPVKLEIEVRKYLTSTDVV
ncbi:MAG: cytochrome c biogenesis protein ResB, partial [Planctomycetota bacterium]|nr:cytochrome c biogenesis protein ResB [Planctomycetota bacterium]